MCQGVNHGMMTDTILHNDGEQLIEDYVDLEKYGVLIKISWKNDPDDAIRRRIKEIMLNQSKGYILIYFTLSSSYNQTLNTVCPLHADVNFATFKLGIIEYFDCLNDSLCVWQNDCNVSIKCDAVTLKLIFYPHHHKILTQGKVRDQKVFINAYCRTINKIIPSTYRLDDFKGSLIERMFQRSRTPTPTTPKSDFNFSPFSPREEFQYPVTPQKDLLKYVSPSSPVDEPSIEEHYLSQSPTPQLPLSLTDELPSPSDELPSPSEQFQAATDRLLLQSPPLPPREAIPRTPDAEFQYPPIPPKLDFKCRSASPHDALFYPPVSPKEEFGLHGSSGNMSKDSSGIADCLCSPKPNLSISSDYEEDWELIAGRNPNNIARQCSKQDLLVFKDSLNSNLCFLNEKLSLITTQLTCIPDLVQRVDELEGYGI